MSEKPSGIAHYAVIHHLACISLSLPLSLSLTISTAINNTHAIIYITVPATTMLTNVTFISLRTSLHVQALCDKLW